MAARIDLTLDCADAKLLAEFWKTTLGYADEPPPAPFGTREEWLAQFDLPDDDSADGGAWLCDPDGSGPRLSILEVPEPKTAKNRLHIDVRVPGHGSDSEKWDRIRAESERLVKAGFRARSVVRRRSGGLLGRSLLGRRLLGSGLLG
ncbi:VOC family protein, partial [Streptomyces clavifer]|uniref:VOC family protein n=1 Tax=Streptomyces clavifer TaxID=68188 RepID=UPI0033F1EF50